MTNSEHPSRTPLVTVRGLSKHYPVREGLRSGGSGVVRAVDNLDLDIFRGETLGLVGESGCGKTTVGRALLRLLSPTSGTVEYDGVDVTTANKTALRCLRTRMQVIFQDPYASLNPRFTVASLIGEAVRVHGLAQGAALERRLIELLDLVGLSKRYLHRYPHEFSGGQRQRIGIARALALSPEFIVCDEAVSALDVSIQAQIINLLRDLQTELGLTYLFISHDLNVVRHLSHRVAVMYLGRLVEVGPSNAIFSTPLHPYTKALTQANPVPDPSVEPDFEVLEGDVPSPLSPPSGCHFHPRCPRVMSNCPLDTPRCHSDSEDASRRVWCHLHAPG